LVAGERLNHSPVTTQGKQPMRPIFIVILITTATLNIWAADKPKEQLNIQTLTLEDAIAYALEHSPKIKQAKITVALAEIDLKQTRWWNWFVPSLTLHQGYEPALAESRLGGGGQPWSPTNVPSPYPVPFWSSPNESVMLSF